MRYARIENDIVVELVEIDGDPAEVFHPSLRFVPASDECAVGWRLVNDVLTPPPPDLDHLRAIKREAIDAAYRASVERGLPWGQGDAIQIDDEYRQNIGALASQAGFVTARVDGFTWPEGGMPYRTKGNVWLRWTTADYIAMSLKVGALFLAIRQRYAALKDALAAAASADAIGAVDPRTGWPN